MSAKPPINMRKTPKQDRSKVTINVIIEACAQLLGEGSVDSLTTNHIAKCAGVSIGTLYQYFPNKSSVLMALADQRRNQTVKMVAEKLINVEAETVEEVTREIIRALISILSRSSADRRFTLWIQIQRISGPREKLPIDQMANLIAAKFRVFQEFRKPQSDITFGAVLDT